MPNKITYLPSFVLAQNPKKIAITDKIPAITVIAMLLDKLKEEVNAKKSGRKA